MKKLTIVIASFSIALASMSAIAIASTIVPDYKINDVATIKSTGKDGVVVTSAECFPNAGSTDGCVYGIYVPLPDKYQGQNNHRVLSGILAYELYQKKPQKT
jgi:type 1 fimbria pilin